MLVQRPHKQTSIHAVTLHMPKICGRNKGGNRLGCFLMVVVCLLCGRRVRPVQSCSHSPACTPQDFLGRIGSSSPCNLCPAFPFYRDIPQGISRHMLGRPGFSCLQRWTPRISKAHLHKQEKPGVPCLRKCTNKFPGACFLSWESPGFPA